MTIGRTNSQEQGTETGMDLGNQNPLPVLQPATTHPLPRPSDQLDCQAESGPAGSAHIPRLLDLAFRAKEHLRRHGVGQTVKKVGRFALGTVLRSRPVPTASRARPVIPDEVLNLEPGEVVEVKSAEEITATLDANSRLGGLMFVPAMRPFCGKRFTVFKRVERLYLEESGVTRKMKNTVLLGGVMCDGLLMRCDRSCFFFWREAWLRRAQPEAGQSSAHPPAS